MNKTISAALLLTASLSAHADDVATAFDLSNGLASTASSQQRTANEPAWTINDYVRQVTESEGVRLSTLATAAETIEQAAQRL